MTFNSQPAGGFLERPERNIFIRIGVTKEEWDKLGALDVGRPHKAAEQVLEMVLRDHLILVQRGIDDGEAGA